MLPEVINQSECLISPRAPNKPEPLLLQGDFKKLKRVSQVESALLLSSEVLQGQGHT